MHYINILIPLFLNDTSSADVYSRQGISLFNAIFQNILHYHTICILNITCTLYVDFETLQESV